MKNNKLIPCVFSIFMGLVCLDIHAASGYTYTSGSAALSGCISEMASVVRNNISVTSGRCIETNDAPYTYKGFLCYSEDSNGNCISSRPSENFHVGYTSKKVSHHQYKDEALSKCKSYVRTNECSTENYASGLVGGGSSGNFKECKTDNNKMYPYYSKSGSFDEKGFCKFTFDYYNRPEAPAELSTVHISGFYRGYSGNASLYERDQDRNVLFTNNLDNDDFSGLVRWSYIGSVTKLEIQYRVDFGPAMGQNDIGWTGSKMYFKDKGQTETYLRTLPGILYTWFYDGNHRDLFLERSTSDKFLHVHYRFRTFNRDGVASQWRYLRPISVVDND